MINVIAFDADDTLWHNEPLYEQTQNQLCELLSNVANSETVVEQLFETEMGNIDLYGYGIKSFTLSMVEAAVVLTKGQITGAEVQKIIDFGKDMLTANVQLIENVAETIRELALSHQLMVITKGDLLDQQSKLLQSGISDHFQHIEVVSKKNRATYAALLAKYKINPAQFLMVGNSLKSDILPVLEVGGYAAYVPYHVTWAHEVVEEAHVADNGYHKLEHLGQLPWLLQKLSKN